MSTEEIQKDNRIEGVKREKPHIVIFVVLMTLVISSYFILNKIIVTKKKYTPLTADGSVIYQVDSIKEVDDQIVLDGFIFKKDTNSKTEETLILLHNLETGKNIRLDTSSCDRKDVNDYFACDYDYVHSGFTASVKKSSIDMEKGKYQIYLFSDFGSSKYSALDEYLIDGQLTNVNLIENKQFDLTGTELENELKDAVIRVSRPDIGLCIYQKDNELYWIADDKYNFEEDGSTFMQYQVFTTQYNKLPQACIDNEYNWCNLGFCFEDFEVSGNFGKYRMSKTSIPTEYSVTNISVGFTIDGSHWVWSQSFYPVYKMIPQ